MLPFVYELRFTLTLHKCLLPASPCGPVAVAKDKIHTAAQWVRVPNTLAKIQHCQVRGNACHTKFSKNTNVELLGTASVFVILVRLAVPQTWQF
jgi:hypothetical protein